MVEIIIKDEAKGSIKSSNGVEDAIVDIFNSNPMVFHLIFKYHGRKKPGWDRIKQLLVDMLKDWWTNEPTCLITDKAFQIYKELKVIGQMRPWYEVVAPLAELLEKTSTNNLVCKFPDVIAMFDYIMDSIEV